MIPSTHRSKISTSRAYYLIKVSNTDNSENCAGIAVIRQIVEKRADKCLFDEDALNLLIRKTGGVLRDLFVCIISAARRANRRQGTRIEQEDAEQALIELGSELSRLVSSSDYDMLWRIHTDEKYKRQIEDTGFLLRKMQSMVVLEYNGKRWHELHPLIADFLVEQGYDREQGVISDEND